MAHSSLDHVCTKKCLRWTVGFGRRWYYCAEVKPIVVKIPSLRGGR